MRIWGKKGAPYLQALHFAYGCGGFIATVMAAFYLSAEVPITGDLSLLSGVQNMTTELLSEVSNTTDPGLKITASEPITIPTITFVYTTIGTVAIVACICFIIVYIFSARETDVVDKEEEVKITDPGLCFTIVVVILACLLTGLTSGVEVSFTQMLTSYVVKSSHNMSKSTGSYMTSVYWGAFTTTRALSIALACKVEVKVLLISDMIVSVIAVLILLTVGTWSPLALWFGAALLGIGVASIFPASLSWVEKYININNRIASVFTLVSCVLEMGVPLFISKYLESQPNVLFQFMTAATISVCIMFVILNCILTRKGEKYVQEKAPIKGKEPEVNQVTTL